MIRHLEFLRTRYDIFRHHWDQARICGGEAVGTIAPTELENTSKVANSYRVLNKPTTVLQCSRNIEKVWKRLTESEQFLVMIKYWKTLMKSRKVLKCLQQVWTSHNESWTANKPWTRALQSLEKVGETPEWRGLVLRSLTVLYKPLKASKTMNIFDHVLKRHN